MADLDVYLHLVPLLAEYLAPTLNSLSVYTGSNGVESGKLSLSSNKSLGNDSFSFIFVHCISIQYLSLTDFDFGRTYAALTRLSL